MAGRRRQRIEHTEDWEQLRLLVKWPEQERYEGSQYRNGKFVR